MARRRVESKSFEVKLQFDDVVDEEKEVETVYMEVGETLRAALTTDVIEIEVNELRLSW